MKTIMTAVLISGLIFSNTAYAERMYIKEGTTRTYESSSGRFTVQATAQTEGGGVWSMKLLDGDKEISQSSFHDSPEGMAVSNHGNVIVSTDPSSHAEFGSESLSIYDANWTLVGKVPFGDTSQIDVIPLKMVTELSLSPDGGLCAVGEGAAEKAKVTLLDVKNRKMVWDKAFGLPEMREIVFSPDGKYLLVATYENDNFDMLAQLVDTEGKVLLEKRIPKNFSSYEVKYVRFKDDGGSFEVFDTASNTYLTEKIPA